MMCEKGVDETVDHLMMECERYEYARTKMFGLVAEETSGRMKCDKREVLVGRRSAC